MSRGCCEFRIDLEEQVAVRGDEQDCKDWDRDVTARLEVISYFGCGEDGRLKIFKSVSLTRVCKVCKEHHQSLGTFLLYLESGITSADDVECSYYIRDTVEHLIRCARSGF